MALMASELIVKLQAYVEMHGDTKVVSYNYDRVNSRELVCDITGVAISSEFDHHGNAVRSVISIMGNR